MKNELETSATLEDVRQAFNALTDVELLRLTKWAAICILGTPYAKPWDLINDAFVRTMDAANGQRGRAWKKSRGVQFMAHMMMVVRGMGHDALKSFENQKVKSIESIATETMDPGAVLDQLGYRTDDIVTRVLEVEEMNELLAKAARVEQHFVGDEDVNWIFEGRKDDYSPAQIRELSGMNQTRYDNALKRIRRAMKTLFPSKEQS